MAIAYFTTWTIYGTWLPGDPRGWFQHRLGPQPPDHRQFDRAVYRMTEDAIVLDRQQRDVVETVIADHCIIREWTLHVARCQTNHVHVVVNAGTTPLERPREQFKSWATRRLKSGPNRNHWWSDRGWDIYVDNEEQLNRVIRYVEEGQ